VTCKRAAAEQDLSALAKQLVATARPRGVELTGPRGLLTGLTRQVLETALWEQALWEVPR